MFKKQNTRNQVIAAVVGILTGGVIVTAIGKTILEFGITLLTGAAFIGSGFMLGAVTFGKRIWVR